MLPSMRYQTRKLAQLYHIKKQDSFTCLRSYHQHKRSLTKIKNKQLSTSPQRERDITKLRNKLHSAFTHTQFLRTQRIQKDNQILYRKCADNKNRRNISLIRLNNRQQGSFNKSQRSISGKKSSQSDHRADVLLINHRASPIHKMTVYDRNRQNMRLAMKIADPTSSISINVKKLQEIHQQAKTHRNRITRYESSELKSSKYIDKKFNSIVQKSVRSSFSIQSYDGRCQNNPQSSKNSFQNQKQSEIKGNQLPKYQTKDNLKFKNNKNENQPTFSLTDYNN